MQLSKGKKLRCQNPFKLQEIAMCVWAKKKNRGIYQVSNSGGVLSRFILERKRNILKYQNKVFKTIQSPNTNIKTMGKDGSLDITYENEVFRGREEGK